MGIKAYVTRSKQMLYSVKYKGLKDFLWKTVKNVKGDFIASDLPGNPRVLVLDNEARIEIPVTGMMFMFSQERFMLIKSNMDKEAGQKIPVNSGV